MNLKCKKGGVSSGFVIGELLQGIIFGTLLSRIRPESPGVQFEFLLDLFRRRVIDLSQPAVKVFFVFFLVFIVFFLLVFLYLLLESFVDFFPA